MVWDESLKSWAIKIERELKRDYLLYEYKSSSLRRIAVKCLEFLGVKDSLKILIGKR